MNNKKIMSRSIVLGLLATFGFFAVGNSLTTPTQTASDLSRPATRSIEQMKHVLGENDFADEEDADPNELSASIRQNTLTDTSQYLTFAFQSKTVSGYKTAIGSYVVQVDDPNFNADDEANPAPEGYENIDEETGLPFFNGSIAFIVGASGTNADVYLPSTLTRTKDGGGFILKITTIKAGAISADGHEYNGKNTWSTGKIKSIHIPSTMTNAEAGAITGAAGAGDAKIYYEGNTLPSGFATDWTDFSDDNIVKSKTSYDKARNKNVNYGGKVDDIPDELGRPINFVLGCREDKDNAKFNDPKYNIPLIIQYDKVTYSDNGLETSRQTLFEELPIKNPNGPYDSVGTISSLNFSRDVPFSIEKNERIDATSIVFHHIYEAGAKDEVFGFDPAVDKPLRIKPTISYSSPRHISDIVSLKASYNTKFAGYSLFTLTMDRNLTHTSKKFPEAHSLYLDVKTSIYEQNQSKIATGETKIRYLLYNLYNSSYHIQYLGNDGQLKDVLIPISSVITYQELAKNKGNRVSILLKDSDVTKAAKAVYGKDDKCSFSPEKVRKFELIDLTLQMDLVTKSAAGSTSILGKSAISYRFYSVTVFESTKDISVFNWNLFLILFFVGYLALYAVGAFILHRILKEKFKNDEFRRVNDKKYLKKAILGGLGGGVVLAAILFIIMRTGAFRNTIIVFNPTDPFLIAFAIAGLIITGYFIVYLVKTIKGERERRKAIRLKLNEDVEDDGTN